MEFQGLHLLMENLSLSSKTRRHGGEPAEN
jgi:hypothetical protein